MTEGAKNSGDLMKQIQDKVRTKLNGDMSLKRLKHINRIISFQSQVTELNKYKEDQAEREWSNLTDFISLFQSMLRDLMKQI